MTSTDGFDVGNTAGTDGRGSCKIGGGGEESAEVLLRRSFVAEADDEDVCGGTGPALALSANTLDGVEGDEECVMSKNVVLE